MIFKPKSIYIKLLIFALFMIDVFLVVYSCQSRSSLNPIGTGLVPDVPTGIDTIGDSPIYVSGESDGEITSGVGSMGAYMVSLDFDELTGNMNPVRNVDAVGDAHIVDITNYLNGSPCGDCFKMESIALNHLGEVEVDFSMKHPFDLPRNNPPAHGERIDLHVFDVQTIFFFQDSGNSVEFPQLTSSVIGPIGGIETMESDNSGFWASEEWDGMTSHFDSFTDGFWATATNVHPYLMFFEDASRGNVSANNPNGITDLFNPIGHNVFPQGGGPEIQTVNFGSECDGSIGFLIVLSAAYGQSARFRGNEVGQRGNPVYMLPEFNRKEAWKVKVEIPPETDHLIAGVPESATQLEISVYDWQHDYGNVVGEIDPLNDPKNSLSRSSKVSGVYVEIPGVSDIDSSTSPISGTGWGDDPLRYIIKVGNDQSASEGQYFGMVAITDELHGEILENYGVERDGITFFDIDQFVTYAGFEINVIDRGGGSFGFGFNMYGEEGSGGGDQNFFGSSVTLDGSGGKNLAVYDNYVYIVSSVYDADSGDGWDVFLSRSTDSGMTFEVPRMLNNYLDDGVYGNQSEPALSIAPDTGEVHIVYTDKSASLPGVDLTQVFYRKSSDFGVTFTSPAIQLNQDNTMVSDQGTVEAGCGEHVWTAFRRYEEYYPNITAELIILHGEDDENEFEVFQELDSSPNNYTYPIILTHPELGVDPELMAVIWRQAHIIHPDLNCIVSYDGGETAIEKQFLSSDSTMEYATNVKAVMNSYGNIYCVYRVNEQYGDPTRLIYSFGYNHPGIGYTWQSEILKEEPDMLFGDLDVFAMPQGNVYICWNQLDNVDTTHGQDIFIYRAIDGFNFSEYAHIEEPTEWFADQDSPRFAGNANGEIYLVYRDNTYLPGGELFLTHSYE